jgi:hypothetical protein
MVASMAIQFAGDVAKILKMSEKQKMYEYYAQRMYVPFNTSGGFHPEYDGYVLGELLVLYGLQLCNKIEMLRLNSAHKCPIWTF